MAPQLQQSKNADTQKSRVRKDIAEVGNTAERAHVGEQVVARELFHDRRGKKGRSRQKRRHYKCPVLPGRGRHHEEIISRNSVFSTLP